MFGLLSLMPKHQFFGVFGFLFPLELLAWIFLGRQGPCWQGWYWQRARGQTRVGHATYSEKRACKLSRSVVLNYPRLTAWSSIFLLKLFASADYRASISYTLLFCMICCEL